MKRITDGVYGLGEQTGECIPAARLRAAPWTRFRKDTASRLECEGGITGPQLRKLGAVERGLQRSLSSNPLRRNGSPWNDQKRAFAELLCKGEMKIISNATHLFEKPGALEGWGHI